MKAEIVPATSKLLDELETWLRAENDAYEAACERQAERCPEIEILERGFFCNWNIVRRSFERDPRNVHVLLMDGAAIGFVDEMDILEVHPNFRRQGLGGMLADFMIRRAFDLGHSVAVIEVAPASAQPFWERMGFTMDVNRRGDGGGIYAFRRFERPQALGAGPRIPYRIAFHDRSRDWDESVEPFSVFEGMGEQQADGSVRLAERAYCFDATQPTSFDCVVRVELAGRLLFEDKVKRREAQDVGLEIDPGSICYFEHLTPQH
ncbi:GNAT family N-acetyltransferase [Enterovirga rhinocerotis]|uniref:Acetyltransferase (GNAT) family protein n=1 Tax=Enterovirga rhinocerotis TaxID=1339210 RepID=A0A4R7BXF5_9HYPH|nr:GNAT family N-acetyltransferase [Enterovirga rhinocerotis]TDR90261.1 acetyltransferase (GNAT) family protein [Enterovirga rhinocerotis]